MCLAIPGLIVGINAGDDAGMSRIGRVDFGGIVTEVNLTFTPDAGVGEYVLVHVGVAISTIDAAAADQAFEYLRAMESHEVS
jgi:hydrogenase expression/formation protein HypC